jgi:hypothetical protein
MEMEDPDQTAPVVDPTGLLPNIIRYCLSEADPCRLALDTHYMNGHFRAHQVVRLIEFASTELHITLLIRAVAHVFEVGHSAVNHAQLRGYDDPLARGRHHELAADAGQPLMDWITAKCANNVAVNRTELLYECNKRFWKSITRGWGDSFLTRQATQFLETKSVPQENPRLEIIRVFLQAGFDEFRDHIYQAYTELVFKLNKIGISEWEDRRTRRVIVPSTMKRQTIFHGVRQNLKHIDVVACISAAGDQTALFLFLHKSIRRWRDGSNRKGSNSGST